MSEWSPPDRSRSRAVLIGTSRYNELTQVPAAANSLESMYRLLTGPLCGWPADRVTRISEPEEPGNLPDWLVELFGQAEDVALFYYVGHGQVDFEDQLCLALVGSRSQSERRATTSLTFEAVRRAMRASPAATKVVILDCCFAGHAVQDRNSLAGTGEDDIAGLVGASGAYTLVATGPASTAMFESEADSPLPHTHFTRVLVDVVARGIPGGAPVLTLEPIYRRLREVLAATGRSTPTRVSRHNADTFAFARNTAPRPEPAPQPPAIGPTDDRAARRQLLDMAEDAARATPRPLAQCHALIQIAAEALEDDADRARRLLDEIERIAATIREHEVQAGLWWDLARTVAALDLPRARGFLAAAEKAITASDVAETKRNQTVRWWSIINPEVLRLDLDTTERIAHAITNQTDRDSFVEHAAKAWASRDLRRAQRLARIISRDSEHYEGALCAIAHAACDHDPDWAERTFREAVDVSEKCRGLAAVAASVAAYDADRASQLLSEARNAADRAGSSDETSRCLREIVDGLISGLRDEGTGVRPSWVDWIQEEAWDATRKISDESAAAHAAIAVARATRGKPDDTLHLLKFADMKRRGIQNSRDPSESHWILFDIAIAMLEVDAGRAADIAAGIELVDPRDNAILKIVPSVAQNDPGKAEVLAQYAARPENRAAALAAVAVAMTREDPKAGMALLDLARRTARAEGGKAAMAIARATAALDPDLAIQILTEDGSAPPSDQELSEITQAALKNKAERSMELAGDIADPGIRAHVFTSIAKYYLRSA